MEDLHRPLNWSDTKTSENVNPRTFNYFVCFFSFHITSKIFNSFTSISLRDMNKPYHTLGIGHCCDVSNHKSWPSTPSLVWYFIFHEQMPFHKKTIADLYNVIVTDEVEYRHKLSEIAWNLLTQVGRHIWLQILTPFFSCHNSRYFDISTYHMHPFGLFYSYYNILTMVFFL